MVNKKFEKIGVDEKTAQIIHFLAKIQNQTISGFMQELFNELIKLSACYSKANFTYIYEYDYLKIEISGKSNLVVGKIPNVPVDISPEVEDKLIFQEGLKLLKNAEAENKEVFEGEN